MFGKISKFIKKHEKTVLFVFLIVIALSFGITGSMIALLEDSNKNVAGVIFGKEISTTEFIEVWKRWGGYLALVDLNVQPAARSYYYPLWDVVGYFAAEDNRRYLEDLTWWVLILREECERLGIRAEEKEVRDYIQNNIFPQLVSPEGDFNYQEYRDYLNQKVGITEAQFETMISEYIAILKYRQLLNLAVAVPLDKVFEKYLDDQTRVNLKYAVFDVNGYQSKVPEIDSEEIIQFFKNNRDKYAVPEKIQIEYLLADSEILKQNVPVPLPEDLDKYYKQHQDDYQITPPPGQSGQEPRYRPFEEVKETIKAEIIRNRAMSLAKDKIDKVNQQITGLILERKPVNLKQLAVESGLVYNQTGFFSRDRISEICRNEIGFAGGFDADIFDYPLKQVSHTFQTSRGYLVFQVLDKTAGYTPGLTVQLKKNISRELRERKARGLAKEAVDKMERTVKEKLDAKTKESTVVVTPELKIKLSLEVFTSVAAEQHVKVAETGLLKKNDDLTALKAGSDFLKKSFGIKEKGEWLSIEEPSKYYLVQLAERLLPLEDDFAGDRPLVERQIAQLEQGELFRKWVEHLRKKANLQRSKG